MKRYLIIFGLLFVGSSFVLAEEDGFFNALSNCSAYYDSGNIQTGGLSVQSVKRILGFQDDRCLYEEKISFVDESTTITCKFTKPQLEELTEVMKAYDTVQKYTNEKVDTSSPDAVENNPVVKVWAKYLKDTSVCSIK